MILAALFSVLTYGVLMFGLGLAIGQSRGKRLARIDALNKCIDCAALVLKGNPMWRCLKPADALLKAGTLIGGNDVLRQINGLRALTPPRPNPHLPNPAFTKGNQV